MAWLPRLNIPIFIIISSTLSAIEGYFTNPNPKISSTIFCQGKWYFLFSRTAAHTTENVHFTPCLPAWKVLGVGFFMGLCVLVLFFFLIPDITAHLKKTYSHWVPHIEAEFKGDVIFCLVFVYVPRCSPPSPLRFISSGNISKFSCMEAFARGCALAIRTEVPGDNAVKTQARVSLKQPTKGLKQIEKKQKQVSASNSTNSRIRCERHSQISEYPNPHTAKLADHRLLLPAEPAL